MDDLPDPRAFPEFADYYRERFRALYAERGKPRGKRATLADIATAEREHRAAWPKEGGSHARKA